MDRGLRLEQVSNLGEVLELLIKFPNVKGRERVFSKSNYRSFFIGGSTYCFAIEDGLPITELEYPEIYDIAINSLCYGNCPYCYVSATAKGKNFTNVLSKLEDYFGSMTMNQRPFQVALGGHGEPTLHPILPDVLELLESLGITPNYTTNGMHLTDKILDYTKEFVGGVSVSAHPHIDYKPAVTKFSPLRASGLHVNLHVIISDKASIEQFYNVFHELKDEIDTFVLLPHIAVGRASQVDIPTDYLFTSLLDKIPDMTKIAYGAYFYDELAKRPELNASIYSHHIFSKYLILDDPVSLYPSSFESDGYIGEAE